MYWASIVNSENCGRIVDEVEHIENTLTNQYVHPIHWNWSKHLVNMRYLFLRKGMIRYQLLDQIQWNVVDWLSSSHPRESKRMIIDFHKMNDFTYPTSYWISHHCWLNDICNIRCLTTELKITLVLDFHFFEIKFSTCAKSSFRNNVRCAFSKIVS